VILKTCLVLADNLKVGRPTVFSFKLNTDSSIKSIYNNIGMLNYKISFFYEFNELGTKGQL